MPFKSAQDQRTGLKPLISQHCTAKSKALNHVPGTTRTTQKIFCRCFPSVRPGHRTDTARVQARQKLGEIKDIPPHA
eukprot:1223519-Rhodomonas_salina.2